MCQGSPANADLFPIFPNLKGCPQTCGSRATAALSQSWQQSLRSMHSLLHSARCCTDICRLQACLRLTSHKEDASLIVRYKTHWDKKCAGMYHCAAVHHAVVMPNMCMHNCTCLEDLSVRTISSKGITCAGEKKCAPSIRSGQLVLAPTCAHSSKCEHSDDLSSAQHMTLHAWMLQ